MTGVTSTPFVPLLYKSAKMTVELRGERMVRAQKERIGHKMWWRRAKSDQRRRIIVGVIRYKKSYKKGERKDLLV